MNIGEFLKIIFFSAIAILLFILAFYPPVVWQSWIDYVLKTPLWITIGQMGFLVLAALALAVGVVFVKELVTN